MKNLNRRLPCSSDGNFTYYNAFIVNLIFRLNINIRAVDEQFSDSKKIEFQYFYSTCYIAILIQPNSISYKLTTLFCCETLCNMYVMGLSDFSEVCQLVF